MKYILTLPRLRGFISLSMGLAIAELLSILAPSAMIERVEFCRQRLSRRYT
jgi:hypothetical protein